MKTSDYKIGSGLLLTICLALAIGGVFGCSNGEEADRADNPTDTTATETATETVTAETVEQRKPASSGAITNDELPPMLSTEEVEAVVRERLANHTPFDWGSPGQFDPAEVPNPFVYEGLGVSITRPTDWVWLAQTSSPNYAQHTDPKMREAVHPALWADPFRTPLIATSPSATPIDGRDPLIRLDVRPMLGPWRMMESFISDQHKVLQVELNRASADHPGLETLSEPSDMTFSGIQGAAASVRYPVTGVDGQTRMQDETIWYLPRPPYLFFLRVRRPADAEASVIQAIDQTVNSLQIENGVAG